MNVERITLRPFFNSLLVSCSSEEGSITENDLDRLCQIYEDVAPTADAPQNKEGMIVARVQDEIPDFFDKHFQYLMDADFDRRYEMIVRAAHLELGEDRQWKCDVMERYFQGEFDVEKNPEQ